MQVLTEFKIKSIKEIGRYTDGSVKGLHLWVNSSNNKYWILRFTLNGKRQDMSLGVYPNISVKVAHNKAIDAKRLVDNGINPITQKKVFIKEKCEEQRKKVIFKDFALQCIEDKKKEWRNEKHGQQWIYTLREFAFPIIGTKTLDEVTTTDILKILKPIWLTKTHTAVRLRGRLEWILGSATTQGLRDGLNPALWRGHLITVLPSPNKIAKTVHHAALPYNQIGQFVAELRELDCLSALALEFTILTATRTSETIGAKTCEIDGNIWTIPAERMKANKEQRIPLVPRALEILTISKYRDPESEYLFSNNGGRLSNMAMLQLIKGKGYKITVHGFRSTFRTWCEEETAHNDSIAKMALAHTIKDKVEAAYQRGDLLKKRLRLMQDWAKFCDTKQQTNILNFKVA